MPDQELHELLAEVAALYYERELTQDAIARQLGISRVKVYRLLKQAKELGVVQIAIQWPIARHTALEEALRSRFQLHDARVLSATHGERSATMQPLAQLAARYLELAIEDGMTLAVCLGRSTYEVIQSLRAGLRAHVDVAQGLGSMQLTRLELDSAALARQLAQRLGGQVHYLSAPLMADTPEAGDILRRQPDIQRTLALARQADVMLLGIGNLDLATSGFVTAGLLTDEEITQLRADGVVGDIGGQLFLRDGVAESAGYNRRVIGLTLDELTQIPLTIAVATGEAKAEAIVGALQTGVVNVLCTDEQTVEQLL